MKIFYYFSVYIFWISFSLCCSLPPTPSHHLKTKLHSGEVTRCSSVVYSLRPCRASRVRFTKEMLGEHSPSPLYANSLSVDFLSLFSCVRLYLTLSTVARQPSLSMRFPRQEYWSGLPCPPPGIFPTQGSNCNSCVFCMAGRLFTSEPPGKPHVGDLLYIK